MEKVNKISIRELSLFFALIAPAVKLLILPSSLYVLSGKDFYLLPLLAGAVDIVFLIGILSFAKSENKGFLDICSDLFGKVGAKILAAIYFIYFFIKLIIPLIEQHIFIIEQLYEATPSFLFFIPIYLALSYGAFVSIKYILRTIALLLPFFIVAYLAIIFLSFSSADFSEVFPFFEFGASPFFKGALLTPIWFGDFILALFVMDKLNLEKKPALKVSLSAFSGIIVLSAMFLLVLAVYGVLTPKQIFPITKISKYSTAFSNLGRVDFLFLIIMYCAMLLNSAITMSLLTDTFSFVTRLKRSYSVIILSVLTFLVAVLFLKRFSGLLDLIYRYLLPFIISVQYVVPFVILLVYKIKCKLEKRKEHKAEEIMKTLSFKTQIINNNAEENI